MADSGLVVVLCVISLLLVAVFLPLITVQYEWCHVLFENNTVINNDRYYTPKLQESKDSFESYLLQLFKNDFWPSRS